MTRRSPVARHSQFQGQILLERALFCVGCEIIFTGTTRCPRCASSEAVWPLSEWVRSVRTSTAGAACLQPAVDESVPTGQQHKRPAA